MNNVSYLKTKSATILWFIKFVTGVLAAYMIFMTVKAMMPAFKAIGETAQSFDKGIGAFIFLLLFCYHKDIARVMTTVDANIKGIEHKMKRTHLSGISFLFGLFMALILFVSFTLENKTTETWIGIVGILGITLKQFLVSINNRNIKQYNK